MDLIGRQAAIDAFWSLGVELRPSAIDAILNMLNGLPSVTPKRKTGKWIIRKFGDNAKCSECGMRFSDVYDMENSDKYCRHCGAKMDGLKVINNE